MKTVIGLAAGFLVARYLYLNYKRQTEEALAKAKAEADELLERARRSAYNPNADNWRSATGPTRFKSGTQDN